MIRISGPQNPAIVEREIETLLNPRGSVLQLPVRPKKWWFGGEAALVQLAITWARTHENSVLVTHVQGNEDPAHQIRSMSRRLFGFVAMLMASEIVDIPDGVAMSAGTITSPERSLRPAAYEQCRNVVEMMFRPVSDFALGSKVYLVSVDHSTLWPIPWLYSPSKVVLDRIAFVSLADELLNKTASSAGVSHIDRSTVSQIGAILHELFANTHEWARTDRNGVPWRRSVRGLTAERHTWSSHDCTEIVHNNPALGTYFQSFREHVTHNRHRFLELTVFDSGLGLARQWLGPSWHPDLTLREEHHACMNCLAKHTSSSRQRHRGLGLAEVMSTLNAQQGFLRVRTGRLSMYRDFSNRPRRDSDDVTLYDFPTASDTPTSLAPVYGTHFQMLLPILHEENG